MSQGNSEDHNLIIRFLMNEASKEDVHQLEDRITRDGEIKLHFEQIRDTWNSIELEKELDYKKVRHDLRKVMNQVDQHSGRQKAKTTIHKYLNSWLMRAAAIFFIGFVSALLIYSFSIFSSNTNSTLSTLETPKGSNSILKLSDGSIIRLNAGSKLSYPTQFSGDSREVFLEGEAFFDVAKDAKRKFIVKTSDVTVKVFGTQFNIKSYPDDNKVETTLVEGAISLQKNTIEGKPIGKEIVLEPNQRIVLYKEQEPITPTEIQPKKQQTLPARKPKLLLSKSIDPVRYVSWKDGQLIFKSEQMKELAITLERRYNVKIHFEDEELRQFRFTGTIENETIEQVMDAIKLASSIDYRMEEREIWLSEM